MRMENGHILYEPLSLDSMNYSSLVLSKSPLYLEEAEFWNIGQILKKRKYHFWLHIVENKHEINNIYIESNSDYICLCNGDYIKSKDDTFFNMNGRNPIEIKNWNMLKWDIFTCFTWVLPEDICRNCLKKWRGLNKNIDFASQETEKQKCSNQELQNQIIKLEKQLEKMTTVKSNQVAIRRIEL